MTAQRILVGHDAAGRVTGVFRGADLDALVATAGANGCAGWVEVSAAPNDLRRARVESGAVVEIDEEPDLDAARARMRISRRQMLLALAAVEWITAEEALAAATTGAAPAALEALLAGMPPADALAARITWAAMTEADRSHPLVAALGAARELTDAQIDAFFAFAATL
jgi:hypothetical protein